MPWSAEYDYNANLVTYSNWLNLSVNNIHSKLNIFPNKPHAELKMNNLSLGAYVSQITVCLVASVKNKDDCMDSKIHFWVVANSL